jgi:hypothetical protein
MKTKIISILMILLILSMPLNIPIVVADEEQEDVPSPEKQCMERSYKGEDFIDFMDSGIINSLEVISAALYGIATVINTINYFITTGSSIKRSIYNF